jgi:hypothetical protein
LAAANSFENQTSRQPKVKSQREKIGRVALWADKDYQTSLKFGQAVRRRSFLLAAASRQI